MICGIIVLFEVSEQGGGGGVLAVRCIFVLF